MSELDRKCRQVGDVTEHFTVNDSDTRCECGLHSRADAMALFTQAEPAPLNMNEEIGALKEFAAKMQRMSPKGRRAAIYWLADFYLGVKRWGR